MIPRTGRTIPWLLGILALGIVPQVVQAQGNAFNPYGNSGYADYREFTIPSYGNNPALPGQSRLNNEPLITRPRANSYSQYMNDDDEGDFEAGLARRGSSAGMSYNEAYQRLNRQRNGGYKANDNKQNDEFVERKRKQDEAFAKALKEKDPVKRSKMLRDIENESMSRSAQPKAKPSTASRAPEPNASPRPSTASRAPAPSVAGSTAPSPSATRRSSAPPPIPGLGTRRPSLSSTPPPPISGSGSPAPRTGGSTRATPPPNPSSIATPPPPL